MIKWLYRIFIQGPQNFRFRVKVACLVLRGPFFVIAKIKYQDKGASISYRLRTLGLPNDDVRDHVLRDVRKIYKKSEDKKTVVRVIRRGK